MTARLLIVPAAGMGTRLGGDVPKLLVPVAGVAMIDRVLSLYRDFIDGAVIVVNASTRRRVESHLAGNHPGRSIECVVQDQPTGMLDAILLAQPAVRARRPQGVWITWCDQVGVRRGTIQRLDERSRSSAALVLPTVQSANPYIHLERDRTGRIVRVLHRREGDTMPPVGESDMGLFAMPAATFSEHLPNYAATVDAGAGTGERNFLPFIPWMAARGAVITFPAEDPIEALGINTPEDLQRMERYLSER